MSSNTPETKKSPDIARKSPLEWAEALGLVRHLKVAPTSADPKDIPHWSHAAASVLHGWGAHEHHEGQPIQLTEAEYRAALAAVDGPPPPYKPHAAAASKHAPKRA